MLKKRKVFLDNKKNPYIVNVGTRKFGDWGTNTAVALGLGRFTNRFKDSKKLVENGMRQHKTSSYLYFSLLCYFNLEYNNVSETFKFIYPNNQSIKTVVYCDNDLSSRLGFGLKREITVEDTSKPVQNLTVKEGSKKSKILSFDTGHVVVTCFNTSSNLTSVSNNQYMASLLADNAGMLTISPCVGEPPSFVPPNFEQDGNNNVPLLCNLLKFNDVGDLVPFQWKTLTLLETFTFRLFTPPLFFVALPPLLLFGMDSISASDSIEVEGAGDLILALSLVK